MVALDGESDGDARSLRQVEGLHEHVVAGDVHAEARDGRLEAAVVVALKHKLAEHWKRRRERERRARVNTDIGGMGGTHATGVFSGCHALEPAVVRSAQKEAYWKVAPGSSRGCMPTTPAPRTWS